MDYAGLDRKVNRHQKRLGRIKSIRLAGEDNLLHPLDDETQARLVHEGDEQGEPVRASLFELPGRTWVIASGAARARARDTFLRPRARNEVTPMRASQRLQRPSAR